MNMAGEIEDADDPLMGESAPESDSSVQTRQDSEKFLKDLEKDLRNDKYLSSEQRDQAKKQIAELRKALKEDPEYPVEEELSDLIETLAADKKKVEAMEVEAGRATAQ
ncbi:MAG TPA: hypothetical protein DF383_04840, partial [Deltaproteobacteria bacterium]|nr:hypothetical protein [Deltaproteobacteria bacterium]